MRTKTICALLLTLQLAGCTSLTPMHHTRGTFDGSSIRPGETVVLKTTHGDKKLEVVSVTPDHVCGTDTCVPAIEVESVKRREMSVGKTIGLVLFIALAVVTAVAAGGNFGVVPAF